MKQAHSKLSKPRKKKVKALALQVAKKEAISEYSLVSSHPLHSSSRPGILCLDLDPRDSSRVLTGGMDNNAIVFNKETKKIIDTLKTHKKKVTDVTFHPTKDAIFTTSLDSTCVMWAKSGTRAKKYSVAQRFSQHTAEVIGCTIHPCGDYLVTASADKSWCFMDLETGECKQQVTLDDIKAPYTQVTFHPDGLILGAATADSKIRFFDIKTQQNVYNFPGHSGPVSGLAFSQNGYSLATSDVEGTVKLWDLRKLKEPCRSSFNPGAGPVTSVGFDASGMYLGVTGSDIKLYTAKGLELVKTWTDHAAEVTACKFGGNLDFVASTSMDRTLKFFGTN